MNIYENTCNRIIRGGAALLLAAALFAFPGCSQGDDAQGGINAGDIVWDVIESDGAQGAESDGDYDGDSAVFVDLNACQSEVYSIEDNGVYVLSGGLDGCVMVDAPDDGEVRIVLNNAAITCASGPAIYVKSTEKLTLTLAEGSVNSVTDGVGYAKDDEGADAAIYSKSDVTINGTGSLSVKGQTAHGVLSKDSLVVTAGALNVTAVKDGLRGKDSVEISGGDFTIVAGSDGIMSNETEEGKGFIHISAGSFDIKSQNDGIQAEGTMQIDGGAFDIRTGEGSADIVLASDATGGWGRNPAPEADSGESRKGIKAGGQIIINDGLFVLDTVDDALHAGGDIHLVGGEYSISTGDDAVHSDANVVIENGVYNIAKCYEGIEGIAITVNGGTFDMVCSDDGFNSANGADGSGGDMFAAAEGCFIAINGGRITIVSDGDCLDSNGDLTITGGVLRLTCNGNGNTALDCSGAYSANGADITTNDGSENSASFPGGGRPGGMGGFMGERPEGGRR